MKLTHMVYILALVTTVSVTDNIITTRTSKLERKNIDQAQQVLQTILKKSSPYQENLARLLLAEIAIQTNQSELAVNKYFEILKSDPDPKIAELALEIAIQHKDFTKAVDIAILWADAASNDVNPQIVVATLILNTKPEVAKVYLTRAAKIEPQAIDQYLLLTYTKLPTSARKNLYTMLQQLTIENRDNPYIYTAAAQIAAQEDDFSQATSFVAHALKLQPNLTHAIQLKAKLIRHETRQDLAALQYLQRELKKNPDNEELSLFYSNALLDNNDVAKALPYLKILKKSKTHGVEASFILGELFLEQQDYTKAYDELINLIKDPIYGSPAKYNLGLICEQQHKLHDAISWYSAVNDGNSHIPATLKAVQLLSMQGSFKQALQLVQAANPDTFIEQKQLLLVELELLVELKETEHAMKLVNNTLDLVPTDVDFLYARSLLYSVLAIPEKAEKDLKLILSIEPEHANALNALGYTLSTQPKRTKEAIGYLKRALVLSPDNPAFMDSMGWVLFRAGKLNDSVVLLQDAYNLSKNSEIAAHLGEVLWTVGNKEQAKKIWYDALQSNPNHDILLETLNRLKVEF